MKTLLRAASIYPADQPLLRDGAVVFDHGRIVAVGSAREIQQQHPDAHIIDLANHLLLPGLVNPHTHLELTTCAPPDVEPSSFQDWILSLPQRLRRHQLPPESIFPAATQAGIDQSLRFGVTTVGDISQQMHLTRPILAQSPLRCISYGEVLGLARLRLRFDELLPLATHPAHRSDRLQIALTPHAPYTVDLPGYRQCIEIARQRKIPLATHLAESPDEEIFLTRQSGPFRELWESLGRWSDPVETFPGSPIRFAHAIGLLDYPTLLAHVNYCSDDDLSLLAAGHASVVYCPRTHAYFNHPPHPFRQMLTRGVNVAVGTDSCASSPDLNPLADLRLLHSLDPSLPPDLLFRLITLNASRALGMADQIGSLTPGKCADIVAFAASGDDPLQSLLEGDALPTHLWINGDPTPSRSAPAH